jgi:hypothetical protein
MKEQWIVLEEFPRYAVSDLGQVINTHTDILKIPTPNKQGIMMVNLSSMRQQHIRSVAVLIANAFLGDIPRPPHFDTPIHLDGDKRNCRADNLAWRPRWFARRYHQQFDPSERATRFGFRRPVRIVETREEFPTSWEAAIKYGLLDFEILLAVQNQTFVFPINQRFEVIED